MRFTPASFAIFTAMFTPEILAEQTGTSTIVLGEVNITQTAGTALSTENVLTSVDVLGGDQVRDKNVMNSWQLLGQMPGIQLTETGQGAESGKVTFRAFNGEGYINGIKTLIDGVPSNVNSGNQRFIDMIFPLDIEYIEVVRGTNDPRYGLHNIGGNINFATRQGGNYVDSRVTYGSFDTREVQLAVGHEEGNFAQNYILAKQDSNGYRDHSESNKYTLGGKWFVSNDEQDFRVGLIARLYHHQAQESGFLTREQLHASRTQSPAKNANDGDDRDMKQLSLHADWQLDDDLSLSSKLYYNSYNDDRTITFTDYQPGNAPRQRRQWDEQQRGMLSNLTWRANDLLTLDGGINYEEQDNQYRRLRYNYGIPTDFDATPARVQNDDTYTLRNIGGYVQAVIQPTDALKIIPAMRVDKFSGNSETLGGVKASLQDYGWIRQPKLSVIYSLTPEIDLYANWGRTFQILTGSGGPAYRVPGQVSYDPSINTGKEVGIKFQPFPGAQARVALWQQDATDEVANMPSTGTTVGLGETRRRGVDMQISAQLDDQWTVWASHAIQEAKVVKAYAANGQSLSGKEVFSTPRYISNVGVDYRYNDDWKFGAQGRAQGSYYIDELNEQGKYGGFVVVDASVSYRITSSTSVDLQVKNLFDREYEYVWYDNFFWGGNDQAMFSPAPGRSAFVSINMSL
ncbi:MAG: TonB-dependent receptor [Pseudomonas alloputida]|uniref:TonB-dependent receptor n=1 Tax=unclassified Pseudomonas TaxID=196821 RepID=UPI001AE7A8BE|nr:MULTISPECIES: TonB-dependent receptor [unclassified Pseudomonas]MBP2272027.1 iron complex outermembrane receptor protein [Pseudomonas sp. BP6]MBP2289002.1 iron complex outermembrane receptor protein [Pseudomonas sp. BP7]HDS1699727.1 TonB-dependent receptor [Pseudomonas putida]HDS1700554.1 TonB-dependent receptor [Pseudomonas putida]